jgi:IclR family KDG regulon transcriptional repressor
MARAKTTEKPAYYTATLGKGLDVMEALAEVEEISLTQLAAYLKSSNATLFRILATLVHRGYVEKLPRSGNYRLTLRNWQLGARALGRVALRDVALEPMRTLAQKINESPHLGVLDGDGVVIVEKVECNQPVRVDTYVGQRAPAHCSALGKIILAFASAETIDVAWQPQRFTRNTVIDRAAFDKELAKVRRQGYAINRGEWRDGVCAVAIPLTDHNGKVSAGLSLTVPTVRFTDEALKTFLSALTRTAATISGNLGSTR